MANTIISVQQNTYSATVQSNLLADQQLIVQKQKDMTSHISKTLTHLYAVKQKVNNT